MSTPHDPDYYHTFFDDLTIHHEDVELLCGAHWLNDKIISFHFLHLGRYRHHKEQDGILFMDPSCSFWVANAPTTEDARDAVKSLNLKKRKLVFIAVNDNSHLGQAGGMHWSLLVYDRPSDKFVYFDSLQQHNLHAARHLAKRIAPFLTNDGNVRFEVFRGCPQQQNGFDCGIFVLSFATTLAALGSATDTRLSARLKDTATPRNIASMRQEILQNLLDEHNKDVQTRK